MTIQISEREFQPAAERSGDPSVSVILATFNRAHMISESIESLLAQTVKIDEIIVVDDGSKDDTEAIVAKFDAPVSYHRKENGGKLSALNVGLKLAKGEFIWFMDDDDIAPPDALENLLAPFAERPELGMTYGRLQKFVVDPETGEHQDFPTHPYPPEDGRSFFVRVMEDCYITGQPCILARRSAYEAIYPLREEITISEDYDVLLKLAQRFPAARVDAVTLLQRQHDGPRGPGERYAAAARNTKWCEADTRLLAELLPTVTLGDLVGKPANYVPTDPLELRQAHLQKGAIAGRKKLWDMATEAVKEGVRAAPDAALRDVDIIVLKSFFGCRYGLDELADDPAILDRLRESFSGLRGRDAAIRAVAATLLYRARMQLREGETEQSKKMRQHYWRFMGAWSGIVGLVSYFGGGALRALRGRLGL